MGYAIVAAVFAVAGFGVGRIKSAKTTAKIRAEFAAVEAKASSEVKSLIAAIRKHL